jgi:hypothetical protein
MAFLNDPLTEPLYSGLLHTIPCAAATVSSNARTAGGASMPGRYMGRSSSPTANSRVEAPALAAASTVIWSAAKLVEPFRKDPPSPTTRTAGSMTASPEWSLPPYDTWLRQRHLGGSGGETVIPSAPWPPPTASGSYDLSMNGWSPSTAEPGVGSMLASIREAIVTVTGPSLVGVYLFGSLATGDFDAGVSDVDLLAVLTDSPSERLVPRLRRMHADLVQANPAWDDRIEVVYISAQGLARCRTATTTIAVISTGRPLEVLEAGPDWTLNWYPAREHAVRLLGPPIGSLIPPIPSGEYIEQVRRSLVGFTKRVPDDAPPGVQAYAILTMCRGLYAIRFGETLSKRAAASWAQQQFPQWANLIRRALSWRRRQRDPSQQDGTATVSESRAFVAETARLALGPDAAKEPPGT